MATTVQPTMHTAQAANATIHLRRQIACRYWKTRLDSDSIMTALNPSRPFLEVALRNDHDVARAHRDVVGHVAVLDQAVEVRLDGFFPAVEIAHDDRAVAGGEPGQAADF